MISCAVLKQAGRYYNYIVPKICHTQLYTVKSGALMFAGNCAAGSAFLLWKPAVLHPLIQNMNAYISISREVTKIFTNWKRIFVVGIACLLALSLVGCYEYRGPYSKADVEEYLTGRYPEETFHIQQKGLQTWECWFDWDGTRNALPWLDWLVLYVFWPWPQSCSPRARHHNLRICWQVLPGFPETITHNGYSERTRHSIGIRRRVKQTTIILRVLMNFMLGRMQSII